jgi:hypothetical protein
MSQYRRKAPTEMALLAPELLFDVVIYSLGEAVLSANDRVSLV